MAVNQPSLKRQVISGVSWTVLGAISTELSKFVTTVFLARLLTPDVFGLMAMIAVFIGFANLFSELGFAAALVQRKQVEERHLSSIFWLNIGTGVLLTGIMSLCAPLIANFYNEPLLIPLTILISLNFTIGAFNDVQTAILQRAMNFKRLMLIELTSIVVAGVAAVLMALAGLGIWTLALQALIRTAVEVIAMWVSTHWKPKLIFEMQAVRELLRFSSNLLGSRIFNYWIRNADNVLIGRYIGPQSLGLYDKAYSLMLLPVTQITQTLASVMFPALSRIQDEKERVKAIILRSHRVIALLTTPMMIGLFVVADHFVPAVYGPKWVEMVPLLRVLCLAALTQPLTSTNGWIYLSQGRTDLQFRWTAFSGVVAVITFLIATRWGVMGVAVAYTLRSYVLLYPIIAIPGRLIGLAFREFAANIALTALLSLVMGLGVWLVSQVLPADWSNWGLLFTETGAGVIIYLILVLLFKLPAVNEVRDIVRKRS